MPNYEYMCQACARTWVESHPMLSHPQQVRCICGEQAFKVFSPVLVRVPNPVSEAREGRGKG